jgi:hypothetical protein
MVLVNKPREQKASKSVWITESSIVAGLAQNKHRLGDYL